MLKLLFAPRPVVKVQHLAASNDSNSSVPIISEDYFDDVNGLTGNQYCEINFWEKPLEICNDAKMSLKIDNAGGDSEISEMYSIDYFHKKYNATDFIFEEQINYWIRYKKVDFLCTIFNKDRFERIGVSVTRAIAYPTYRSFTDEKAFRLLDKKLLGLIVANNSLQKNERYLSSFLHIWCQDISVALVLKSCFEKINFSDYNLDYQDVTLIITITKDQSIYKNVLD